MESLLKEEFLSGSIDSFLESLVTILDKKLVACFPLKVLAGRIEGGASDGIIEGKSAQLLADKLSEYCLTSEPKIAQGFISRSVDSIVAIYKEEGDIDRGSYFYKYGRLLVQVSVIMARADSVIEDSEIERIKSLLWSVEVFHRVLIACRQAVWEINII